MGKRATPCIALLTLLLAAPVAGATVTDSQITTPTDATSRLFDLSAGQGPYGIQVAGTVVVNSGSNKVDIRCYANGGGGAAADTLGTFTVDNTTKTFSGYIEPNAMTRPCLLRAVNTNSEPTGEALARFKGVRYYPSVLADQRITALQSPNVGTLFDVFDRWISPDRTTSFAVGSLGGCGIYQARPLDPGGDPTLPALDSFMCAGYLDDVADADVASRSDLQIDGRNAFTSGMLKWTSDTGKLYDVPGQPGLTAGRTTDPGSGHYALEESSPVVFCGGTMDAYPPASEADGKKCAPLTAAGVSYARTTDTTGDGRQITVTDRWTSTNGAPHGLDMLFEIDLEGTYGLQLPWLGPDFKNYVGTDSLAGPAGAPATLYVRSNMSRSDAVDAPVGSVTMSTAPNGVEFYDDHLGFASRYVQLHYIRTIPAGGTLTIQHTYGIGTSLENVRGIAARTEDRLVSPFVTMSVPSATVTVPQVTVTGTATDNGGLRTLTFNGIPIAWGAGGAFSAVAALKPGPNLLVVQATDTQGNTAQAQLTVTYAAPGAPCVVPKIVGLTKARASSRLKSKNCALGKARTKYYKPRKVRKNKKLITVVYKKGTVVTQGVKAGARLAGGAKVAVTLQGRKPKPSAKQKSAAKKKLLSKKKSRRVQR